MLQQSYFIGGGIRFYDKSDTADQTKASYLVIGNYPSSSTNNDWYQYGKLIFLKDSQRDLLTAADTQSSRRRNL